MNEFEEKTKTTSEVNHFGVWIKSVPVGDYTRVRQEVITRCKINAQIFRFWRAGITRVPVLAQPIIEEIAGSKIFTSPSPHGEGRG